MAGFDAPNPLAVSTSTTKTPFLALSSFDPGLHIERTAASLVVLPLPKTCGEARIDHSSFNRLCGNNYPNNLVSFSSTAPYPEEMLGGRFVSNATGSSPSS